MQVADGYLFLDWFAIPQITARTDGVNEDATRSDAALAVQSIPAYVEACDAWGWIPDMYVCQICPNMSQHVHSIFFADGYSNPQR